MEKSKSTYSIETLYDICPICSSSIKPWRLKNAGGEIYKLDICVSCGYAFVNPRPSLALIMNYYSSFGHFHDSSGIETPSIQSVIAQEQNYPNSTVDARRIVTTINSLTNNVYSNKLLDVGCGYGFFSKEALGAGFNVIALELAENEREISKEMTGLNPIACSFEEFECVPKSLSVVLMSQILEHALDVNLWIRKAHNILLNDGIIAIALPNFSSIFRIIMQENDPYICPPAHLNFFSQNSVSKLLENHGFGVEAIQWVSRIPKRAFEKRLPTIGKPLLPIITAASSALLKTIDVLQLGMMINVYGRKISD
jgi:2-polyprenyl-3-methyl-5-hydroxy-6-metoxy-1,4-benzoquinol methylase